MPPVHFLELGFFRIGVHEIVHEIKIAGDIFYLKIYNSSWATGIGRIEKKGQKGEKTSDLLSRQLRSEDSRFTLTLLSPDLCIPCLYLNHEIYINEYIKFSFKQGFRNGTKQYETVRSSKKQ